MPNLFAISRLHLLAGAVLALAAPLSMAHDSPDVSWSISIGSPRVYAPPPVVYVQPEPVYVQPEPVYVQPQPVYVQPAPAIRYGQPYYVEEIRPGKFRHHHWKHDRYDD